MFKDIREPQGGHFFTGPPICIRACENVNKSHEQPGTCSQARSATTCYFARREQNSSSFPCMFGCFVVSLYGGSAIVYTRVRAHSTHWHHYSHTHTHISARAHAHTEIYEHVCVCVKQRQTLDRDWACVKLCRIECTAAVATLRQTTRTYLTCQRCSLW